jgi:hypothetical protein
MEAQPLPAPNSKYPSLPRNRILQGDALDVLRTFPDESIQAVITSPPYWRLRDYQNPPSIWGGDPACTHAWGFWWERHDEREPRLFGKTRTTDRAYGQASRRYDGNHQKHQAGAFCLRCGAWRGCLGLEPTPDLYVRNLLLIFRELYRILRADGACWLNLGDCFAGPASEGKGSEREQKKEWTAPGGAQSLRPKNLVGIPWRVAFALQGSTLLSLEELARLGQAIDQRDLATLDDFRAWVGLWEGLAGMGWYLRSDTIYSKLNCLPESVRDRPTRSHEYVFLLSKRPRYYYDAIAIQEPVRSGPADQRKMLDAPPRRGGKHAALADSWNKVNAAARIGQQRAVGSPLGRNKRSVWSLSTSPYQGGHFATMPPALVEICLLSTTSARACEHCGAPWERVVARAFQPQPDVSLDRGVRRPGQHDPWSHWPGSPRGTTAALTRGWRPTCQCAENRGAGRSVVLDPFAGSGTVPMVARRNARDWIGIDLNPAYCQLAEERVARTSPPKRRRQPGAEEPQQLVLFAGTAEGACPSLPRGRARRHTVLAPSTAIKQLWLFDF